MNKKKVRNGGMGIVSFLTVLFVVLKVTGAISWSWLWVLFPIWISVICAILLFGIVLVSGKIAKGKW